jgi:ABC-type transporter Mla maintaining outer membrane lipid asymmetry permease subunit MlaE
MEFWKIAVPAILPPVNLYSIRAKLAVAVAVGVGVGVAVAVAQTDVGTEAFQKFLREALENQDFCACAS